MLPGRQNCRQTRPGHKRKAGNRQRNCQRLDQSRSCAGAFLFRMVLNRYPEPAKKDIQASLLNATSQR